MKKEQVLIGLGVATAMVAAFNGHAQADEVVNKHSTAHQDGCGNGGKSDDF